MNWIGIKINEDIKKMADLLRSGNTMLNMACPVCNNPVFRNKGGVLFCPVCNKKVVVVKNIPNQNGSKILKENIAFNGEQEEKEVLQNIKILDMLKNVLFEKINWITHELKTETQLHLIETYSKILLNFFQILTKLPSEIIKNQ